MNSVANQPIPATTQADRIRGIERCLERIEQEHKTLGHDLARMRRLVDGIGKADANPCPCPAGVDGGETCKFCGKLWSM